MKKHYGSELKAGRIHSSRVHLIDSLASRIGGNIDPMRLLLKLGEVLQLGGTSTAQHKYIVSD